MQAVEDLKRSVEIPATIREVLPHQEQSFMEHLDVMAEQAFDDQCTGANPRYPLISDLKELYTKAYWGEQGDRPQSSTDLTSDDQSTETDPVLV